MKTLPRAYFVVRYFFISRWQALSSKELFWKARNRILLVQYFGLKNAFYAKNSVDESLRDSKLTWSILSVGLSAIVQACALFALTEYSDQFVGHYLPRIHGVACEISNNIFDFLSLKIKADVTSITGLVNSISAVAGVFLGLYFTAISVGAGQLGALHLTVRRLVVSERVGSKYMRSLTVLTLFSFMLSLKMALTVELTPLSLFVLTVFALYSVGGFFSLGTRSFFLAEPAMLSEPIVFETHKYLQRLSRRDLFSKYGPIEDYFRRTVKEKVSSLQILLKLAVAQKEKGDENSKYLLTELFRILIFYRTFKQGIPTESRWFESIPRHDNWLYPEVGREETLHNMGAMSPPQMVPDRDWLEKDILKLFEDTLKTYTELKAVSLIISTVSAARPYMNTLAGSWASSEAIAVYRTFEKAVTPLTLSNEMESRERLQLIELIGFYKIEIAVQVFKSLYDFDSKEEIQKLAERILKKPMGAVHSIPRGCREVIDQVLPQLNFEKKVEGRLITPAWYLQQIIAKEYAAEMKKTLEYLIEFIDSAELRPDNSREAAVFAVRAQREIELTSRIETAKVYFVKKIEELHGFQKIKDREIALLSRDFEGNKLTQLRSLQMNNLAECLNHLYDPKRDSSQPDLFGMCFRQLIHELYVRLEKNDLEGFKKLFPKVLLGSFLARDRLQTDMTNLTDDAKLRIAIEPIIDLMHLSGYALAFSDIYEKQELADPILDLWEGTFRQTTILDTPDKMISWLLAVHKFQRSGFGITATSHLRSSWEQSFEKRLNELDLVESGFGHRRKKLAIPNYPLLRAVCAGGHAPSEEPTEWFLAFWIFRKNVDSKKLDMDTLNFWRDFQEALDEQE